MGTLPRSACTREITGVASWGSPGPLDRNTPSGLRLRTVSALVFQGTMVTRQPRFARERTMFSFMPQSTATTWYFSSWGATWRIS